MIEAEAEVRGVRVRNITTVGFVLESVVAFRPGVGVSLENTISKKIFGPSIRR